jgi:conflict system pore-forming effector with SLATT domain
MEGIKEPKNAEAVALKSEKVSADVSLAACLAYIESQILERIKWYRAKKRPLQKSSKLIRFVSLATLLLGALCPLASGVISGVPSLDRLGYVFLGLSGGLLLFDKLFGVSAGWIRFISAAQSLEALLDGLRLDWATTGIEQGAEADCTVLAKRAEILTTAASRFHAVIDQETKEWAAEFQNNLRELQQRASANASPKVTPAGVDGKAG